MAFSPHRNNTHQQPPRQQRKCGHGPRMVRMEPQVGMKPQIGEDGTSDRDRTPCCTYKKVEVECVPMMVDGSTGGEVVGWMYASTPIPPLGPSPQRPKQDKCLPEEEIEQEKSDLDKKKWKNGWELRIPT